MKTVRSNDWDRMRAIVPRGYVCYRTDHALPVDGTLTDAAWERAPWTDEFVDIEGDVRPRPLFSTRAKMLWDDRFFYVGARLEEPHVWGTLTRKNSIIFQDNDFEVFIDPDGDNHNYYEFEINPLGTIWELTLQRPYKDGGPAVHGTNLDGLRSAVHVAGTLNDPGDRDEGWTVEIAFPFSGLGAHGAAVPPVHGDQWRVNFSRVEWEHRVEDGRYHKVEGKPEDNWIWSPQGLIDMHRPERWGFVQFSTSEPGTDSFQIDPSFAARELLMEVYHAQKVFHAQEACWAETLGELGLERLGRPSATGASIVAMCPEGDGFTATADVRLPGGAGQRLCVNHESKLWTGSTE